MLKRIIISLTAVMFLLGAGSSFAASLSSTRIMNGETSRADVESLFGEPIHSGKDVSGKEKISYEKDGTTLDVTFKNGVVWYSREDSVN